MRQAECQSLRDTEAAAIDETCVSTGLDLSPMSEHHLRRRSAVTREAFVRGHAELESAAAPVGATNVQIAGLEAIGGGAFDAMLAPEEEGGAVYPTGGSRPPAGSAAGSVWLFFWYLSNSNMDSYIRTACSEGDTAHNAVLAYVRNLTMND